MSGTRKAISRLFAGVAIWALATTGAEALVRYDRGRLEIDGIQLLQSVDDPDAYQYLAADLTVARNAAGERQLSIVKYVGDENSGGLFHALVQLDLGAERREELARRLEEVRPGAVLRGPVAMTPTQDAGGSFQIVSAILRENAEPGARIAGTLVHSGSAPFAPGSRAAIAAELSPEAATLLWESLSSPTADLSIAVRGHYEARVEAYNAVVRADVETIYEHQSFVDNVQEAFTKSEVRDVADLLIQDQAIEVEVFDRSVGLSIDAATMDKIVDLVTDKLIELVFDRDAGWARAPEPVVAVEQDQICGRLERGFFSKLFSGATDDPYCTDDQYVVKDIEDVAQRSFTLNLSKATTIRVPFDTAGNLGGFHRALEPAARDRHFRVVDLDDPAFESVEVAFLLDGSVVDAFGDVFSSASVNLRRRRPDGRVQSEALVFDSESVGRGETTRQVSLRRLGQDDDGFRGFEYQVAWSLEGMSEPLRAPSDPNEFFSSADAGVQLTPPLAKERVAIDVDNSDFAAKDVQAVVVQIAAKVGGRPRFVEQRAIRADAADPSFEKTIFADPGEPLAIRRIWHTRRGRFAEAGFEPIEGGYVFVFAPEQAWFDAQAEDP